MLEIIKSHNPYFNRWFSAIKKMFREYRLINIVTILILIDGFLQYDIEDLSNFGNLSHNPYFNRWFSAIEIKGQEDNIYYRHNPYFNRWFSAI